MTWWYEINYYLGVKVVLADYKEAVAKMEEHPDMALLYPDHRVEGYLQNWKLQGNS